MHWDKLVF